jgi:Domain of unknown function (DUF3883)
MNSNQLAIIVAYYLSKFDKEGLRNLGYKNDSEAFEQTALVLGIKKNYVKFRRDEFDPIHPWRKGWQRPMDNRIIRAIEALQDLNEVDLRDIVRGILTDSEYRKSEEVTRITSLFTEEKKLKKTKGVFILRGPTGKFAEEFYIEHYSKSKAPIDGKLVDCRELGAGYDFKIETSTQPYFVEVKGLSEVSGGVLFTNKEWITAKEKGNSYFLCVISNIGGVPVIKFIENPATKLNSKKNVFTTVQINWSVSEKELSTI